jgi:hypothetical protein
VAKILAQVRTHLENGHPKAALETISRANIASPWLANAMGVCQLRLGNTEAALGIYRKLVLSQVGASVRYDALVVFKANYATALLAEGNLQRGLLVLGTIKKDPHPAVQKLRNALEQARQKLTPWQKLQWSMGMLFTLPVSLDFPRGDLE